MSISAMPPLVEHSVFAELSAGTDADFVAELVETFVDEAPQLLQGMREALAAGDETSFRRHAHALKSNGNTFGALGFAAEARALEQGGFVASGQPAAAVEALAALFEAVAAELRELCDAR